MDVKFERIAGGTRVTMNYRAAGFAKGDAATDGAAGRPGAGRADEALPGLCRGSAEAGYAQALLTSVTVRQAGVSAVGIWSS